MFVDVDISSKVAAKIKYRCSRVTFSSSPRNPFRGCICVTRTDASAHTLLSRTSFVASHRHSQTSHLFFPHTLTRRHMFPSAGVWMYSITGFHQPGEISPHSSPSLSLSHTLSVSHSFITVLSLFLSLSVFPSFISLFRPRSKVQSLAPFFIALLFSFHSSSARTLPHFFFFWVLFCPPAVFFFSFSLFSLGSSLSLVFFFFFYLSSTSVFLPSQSLGSPFLSKLYLKSLHRFSCVITSHLHLSFVYFFCF